jgi:hypothetical protein
MGKMAGSAPLAGGAPVVVQHQEGAKRMQLDVVVHVVVLDCSGRTPDRRIERSSVVAHGGRRLGSCAGWRSSDGEASRLLGQLQLGVAGILV